MRTLEREACVATRAWRALGAALLIPALCAACASGGGATAEADAGRVATIVVENAESPGNTTSVTLVSSTGDRRLLGAVGPLRTETFTVAVPRGTGYRLVAGSTRGGEIVSELFALSPGATIRWVLPFNDLHRSSPG